MQTMRFCTTPFILDLGTTATCESPLIFATYLCGMGDPDVPVTKLADPLTKAVVFGGGLGQSQYSIEVDNPTIGSSPCLVGVTVCTAICKLPVSLTTRTSPTILPNLMQTRVQAAVGPNNDPDTDVDVLWRRYEHLRWARFTCDSSSCWDSCCEFDTEPCQPVVAPDMAWMLTTAASTGWYGRTWGRGEFRVKTKRRLDDNSALFIVQNFMHGLTAAQGFTTQIGVQWDAYLRYAVKRSR